MQQTREQMTIQRPLNSTLEVVTHRMSLDADNNGTPRLRTIWTKSTSCLYESALSYLITSVLAVLKEVRDDEK